MATFATDTGTCLQPNFTFICHPAAGPTVHQHRLFQTCFPIFSIVCLKLAATNSDSLSVFRPRKKLFYLLMHSLTLIRPATSASKVTTVWCYINSIIIIIIICLAGCRQVSVGKPICTAGAKLLRDWMTSLMPDVKHWSVKYQMSYSVTHRRFIGA